MSLPSRGYATEERDRREARGISEREKLKEESRRGVPDVKQCVSLPTKGPSRRGPLFWSRSPSPLGPVIGSSIFWPYI